MLNTMFKLQEFSGKVHLLKVSLVFLMLFFVLFTTEIKANIINVPTDHNTIQAGIDAAVDNDTVLVAVGTYEESINFDGKNITVASHFLTTQDTSYIDQTIIDGGNTDKVVIFENEEDSTTLLTGFTIQNGYASGSYPEDLGGGIYCHTSNPTLSHLKIIDNTARNGGGICCVEANPVVKHTTFDENNAEDGAGGAICCLDNSNPSLQDLTIINNTATNGGGGIYSDGSMFVLENAIIDGNYTTASGLYAYGQGGGLCLYNGAEPTIENVIINDNSSHFGGGIYCNGSFPILDNVQITNNSTSGPGGGMYFTEQSSVEMSNVTISYNTASNYLTYVGYGGGIYFGWSSGFVLQNATIYQNTAAAAGGGIFFTNSDDIKLWNVLVEDNTAQVYHGGGICCYNSEPVLTNLIITYNLAPNGGGIYGSSLSLINSVVYNNSDGIYVPDGAPTIEYCNFYDNANGNFINCSPGTGCIEDDPLFFDPGNGDFHLTAGSPCVDTGTPDTTDLNLPAWDLDKNIRVWDGNGDDVVRIDMGAYEFGAPPFAIDDPSSEINNEQIIFHYPNPIQNRATISYSLKQNSRVKLDFYNIKGQLIKSVLNKRQPSGKYSIEVNTVGLNSGVYLYKIQTDYQEQTKKVLILK